MCSDSVHDECLTRLMAYADRLGDQHKDLLVTAGGTDPNRKPHRYARLQGNAIDFVNAADVGQPEGQR